MHIPQRSTWRHLFSCIECALVLIFCVLPPVLASTPFHLPEKPLYPYDRVVFVCSLVLAAAYEEALYRVYLPYRLNTILPLARPSTSHTLLIELAVIMLFALAHRYLGRYSMLFAAGAGTLFRFLYLTMKKRVPHFIAFFCITAVHSGWNVSVYYYLYTAGKTA
ncbi:MAG: CPBP family intramembrane glutamic endopeptidase [Treponema sp.]